MNKNDISDFEDSIVEAKDDFYKYLEALLKLIRAKNIDKDLLQDNFNEVHKKGIAFFNLFSRSLTEYGLPKYDLNVNIRDSKVDDAINISNSIINYWDLINILNAKYEIPIPRTSKRAFSDIQVYIKTFEPAVVSELRDSFLKVGLPIFGFESKRKFKDMTKKKQTKFGIIAGTTLLAVLIVIALIIECPTNFQSRIFNTILALAGAAFAAAIPGLINVKYRGIITASGAIAVFVIIFLLKPAELSDFKDCQASISGTVYFGDKPQAQVELRLLKQNQLTNTDDFGNFRLPIDYSTIDEDVKIHLINKDINLDTTYRFEKDKIKESLDIYLPIYCITCRQSDSIGVVLNRKRVCSASKQYIKTYVEGFQEAGINQGRIVECVEY